MGLKTARSKLNLLVFLAASFWAWGCGQAIESDIFVPIRLDRIPQGIAIGGDSPKGIEIRVRGTRSQIRKLFNLKLHFPIDLAQAWEGSTIVSIKPEALMLPEGITVLKIEPSQLMLRLIKEEEKKVVFSEKMILKKLMQIPVNGKGTSYPFRITPPVINIEVKGPVHLIDQLEHNGTLHVYMDLKDLKKAGIYPRRATISLPVGIVLVSTKPEIFTVTLFTPPEGRESFLKHPSVTPNQGGESTY
ncbi:MAG: hypothetical protein A2V65_06745 [Deltaproteobacteria bacterium RBG_13_49_15]|nr:MAG: hypothetical protein A2V65_06745 [Deltaproteobacteria bacterium RBG_13_49_15]